MTEFNQDKFESKAKKLVVEYLNYEINGKEVSIVFFKKGEVYAEAMLKDLDDHRFVVRYFYEEGVYFLEVPYCQSKYKSF
ncbi:hypothetical protein [Limosilactobacillus fermentum]|uniref:hypothetical protein n=1 Tax=Limosilactobacillus fermentum TaxID=1613 RepID=UPI0034D3BE0C